jgi:hypothetical protein
MGCETHLSNPMSRRLRTPLLSSPSALLLRRQAWLAALLIGASALTASVARAESFEVPPDPRDRPPAWNVEPRLEVVFPVVVRRLCPDGAACPYGSGFGLGVLVERRYRSGVGLGLAYDLRFMDGDNLFELSTVQSLAGSFRYFFLPRSAAHPFVGVEVGAVLFGNTFQVSTGGVHVDGRAGVEIEASDVLSFTLYGTFRALYTVPFTSQPDAVRRSSSGGLDLTFSLGAGLALRFGP